MEACKRGSNTVWDCKYHLVSPGLVTKYRYGVLGGERRYAMSGNPACFQGDLSPPNGGPNPAFSPPHRLSREHDGVFKSNRPVPSGLIKPTHDEISVATAGSSGLHYGNDMHYIAARLRRHGFERLAINVEGRKLSARFAKELAATVPSEHLNAVTKKAELVGPRRPI